MTAAPATGPRHRAGLLAAGLLLLLSCQLSSTPEDACERFIQAVRLEDAGAVFDSLMQTTQWSLHTAAKYQKQARALIERSYPEPERSQALSRLQQTGSGRDLFRILYAQRYAPDFKGRLGSGPLSVRRAGDGAATCSRPGGQPYRFATAPSGRWGMAELDGEWDLAKIRAVHDLDTVRENARLYQQAHGKPK